MITSIATLYLNIGELRCIELDIKNSGSVGLKNIHIISTVPGLFSFGKPRSLSMFEYPLLEKQYSPLRVLQENGSVSQVTKLYMDFDSDFDLD